MPSRFTYPRKARIFLSSRALSVSNVRRVCACSPLRTPTTPAATQHLVCAARPPAVRGLRCLWRAASPFPGPSTRTRERHLGHFSRAPTREGRIHRSSTPLPAPRCAALPAVRPRHAPRQPARHHRALHIPLPLLSCAFLDRCSCCCEPKRSVSLTPVRHALHAPCPPRAVVNRASL